MKTKATEARFAYEGLDRVIHERARLSVLTSLITHPNGLSFADLKRLCNLTDGNLARHLQVLEKDGLVKVMKDQPSARNGGGRTQTVCHVTGVGRKRFLEYLSVLETVVRDAAAAPDEDAERRMLNKLSLAEG